MVSTFILQMHVGFPPRPCVLFGLVAACGAGGVLQQNVVSAAFHDGNGRDQSQLGLRSEEHTSELQSR